MTTYVRNKLLLAVTDMAASSHSIQQRLLDAYISHLHVLQKKDFKGEELAIFVELEEESTRIPPKGDEGGYAATLLSMTDEQAEKHAEKICNLYQTHLPD